MSGPVFNEEQKFTQRWVQVLLYSVWAGMLVLSIFLAGEREVGLMPAIALFLFISAFVLAFKSLQLQTRITGDAISYRFVPVQGRWRVIRRQDIVQMGLVSYDPLSDYGGWGIRFGRKGIAYTVRGNKGLLIKLPKNKLILIGTSRPDELSSFLHAQGYVFNENES